ncbi:MAG: metallopeptidase TldD-related protein [Nanoarchaeota archaeon]
MSKRFERYVEEDPLLPYMNWIVRLLNNQVSTSAAARKLKTPPRVRFASISHYSVTDIPYEAYFGILTENQGETRENLRLSYGKILMRVLVGSGYGGCGEYYRFDDAPPAQMIKTPKDIEGLRRILQMNASKAFVKAERDYLLRLTKGAFIPSKSSQTPDLDLEMVILKETEPTYLLDLEKEKGDVNLSKIIDNITKASGLLSIIEVDGKQVMVENARAKLQLKEVTRRYVNSQGSTIKDFRKEYYVKCEVTIVDEKNRKVPLANSFVVPELSQVTEKRIMTLANGLKSAAERAYHSKILRPDDYICMLGPDAMAVFIHEMVAHSCDTRTIQEGWRSKGYTNFGQKIGPSELSIKMISYIKNRDGSYVLGSREVDAEGVKRTFSVNGRDRKWGYLIHNGVLVDFIADRAGAAMAELLIGNQGSGQKPNISMGNAYVDLTGDMDYDYDSEKNKDILLVKTPGPRQPILEVIWKGEHLLDSEYDAFTYLKDLCKTTGKQGIFIENATWGETLPDGSFILEPLEGFLVKPSTDDIYEIPVKMIHIIGGSHTSFENIQAMYNPAKMNSFFCGDNESGEIATSIRCGGGIITNLDFSSLEVDRSSAHLKFKPIPKK